MEEAEHKRNPTLSSACAPHKRDRTDASLSPPLARHAFGTRPHDNISHLGHDQRCHAKPKLTTSYVGRRASFVYFEMSLKDWTPRSLILPSALAISRSYHTTQRCASMAQPSHAILLSAIRLSIGTRSLDKSHHAA